jgi:hypothetical protein
LSLDPPAEQPVSTAAAAADATSTARNRFMMLLCLMAQSRPDVTAGSEVTADQCRFTTTFLLIDVKRQFQLAAPCCAIAPALRYCARSARPSLAQ